MKTKSVNSAGFSLVEVMLSSIILLIVSSGIMAGIIAALKAQTNASDYYRATCIARNRIQHARSTSFSSYSSIVENVVSIDANGNLVSDGDFARSTIASNAGENLMSVTVQVWYSIKPGVTSAAPVTVQTMIQEKMQL